MDWVTALPPVGDRSYNACLVLVDRYNRTPMFLPCHKDDTAMDTAIMICNKFQNDAFKARHHANRFMQDFLKYTKERWDKRHKPPSFKIRDLALVSTLKFNNIKGPKKLKDSFARPSIITVLNGLNSVQLELTGELMNKNPAFPVSLLKTYSSSDKELFPLINKPTLEIPPLEEGKERKIIKVLKYRGLETKKKGNTL
ncbi:hypothetical protein O181_039885 [Austropuccinia psidii MF-1]|uniref:Uncharacterized protein n=1 Tax=Austropuccinia psidii MF-1 TaxID=1389203 RepID=A0A9Q3HFL0_9BASI|nr:hypothetical protein [Austropuccinia psidii MF-1]